MCSTEHLLNPVQINVDILFTPMEYDGFSLNVHIHPPTHQFWVGKKLWVQIIVLHILVGFFL